MVKPIGTLFTVEYLMHNMSSEITGEDERCLKVFQQSEVYERLFELLQIHINESDESEYDTTQIITDTEHNFTQKEVQGESKKEIKLAEREESGYRTIVKCTMEDETIETAYIDIGQQVDPLMGQGYRIRYENDEYTEGRWMS